MTEIAMPEGHSQKDAGPNQEEPKKLGKRSTPWRDNIEAMLMAVVMAIVLKYFIVEAYRIPTGSMQPTLMGNSTTGVYDRILVDKLTPVLRAPRRFETWVFRYPLDQAKNYVKRVVGVGPEEFRVHNGDLWHRDIGAEDSTAPNDGWKVLRRPRGVQNETWLALIKEDAGDKLFFSAEDSSLSWSREVEHKGDFRMRYGFSKGSVMDNYNDGYPDGLKDKIKGRQGTGVTGANPVGDLRVSGEVTPMQDCEWVEAEILEGHRLYTLRIPGPASKDGSKPTITVKDRDPMIVATPFLATTEGEPMRLKAGSTYQFGAQNLDDLLELELDGEILCGMEIETASTQISALYLENKGGVRFEHLMVYRDIFYTPEAVPMWTIPADHFFMMGDNTVNSSDSRKWQVHRMEVLDADGNVTLVEGNHLAIYQPTQSDFNSDENPAVSHISTEDLREITWFRDSYGEMHTYEAGEAFDADPSTEWAPFVPKSKMLGRALSVFWPIKPFDDVWRFKWVR